MKVLLIILSVILLLGGVLMAMNSPISKIEKRKYKVVKSFNDFEIRKYEDALFSSVKLTAKSYEQAARNGFSTLAGYIFGGNSDNVKIAMTSPVVMEMDSVVTMRFMVPSAYSKSELPVPNDSSINLSVLEGGRFAVKRFVGWASDAKIEEEASSLRQLLKDNNISFEDKIIYQGYNPPYQVVNRRNEVMFKVND